MSSGNQFERLFKLWATVSKLVVDGRRSADKIAAALQSIVDESVVMHPDLYFHNQQADNIPIEGRALHRYLEETGLINSAYSLEDDEVNDWINNPVSYPERFRKNRVFLWKSMRASGDRIEIAYLLWQGNRIAVNWYWLDNDWIEVDPALLRVQLSR